MARGLSAIVVEKVKKPGLYRDHGASGLYLQVGRRKRDGVSKSWLFRFFSPTLRRQRWMGLGSYPSISIAMARTLAVDAKKQVSLRLDPIDERRKRLSVDRADAAKRKTFRQCAEIFLDEQRRAWRSKKHAAVWRQSLEKYVYPVIGEVHIADVDRALIKQVLHPIFEAGKFETMVRVQQRIGAVLAWAAAEEIRSIQNPARLRLFKVPKKRQRVKHLAAVPYDQLSNVMAELKGCKGVAPLALRFCILTASRPSEVVRARSTEFDLEKRIWAVPADRIKSGVVHRVPLSADAVAILRSVPSAMGNPFKFVGARPKAPLTSEAMLKLLKQLRPCVTVHGTARSAFRTWAAEQTSYPRAVVEKALAHEIESDVEAAYLRTDFLEQRRPLMVDWANYLSQPKAPARIIPLRSKTVTRR